MSQLSSVFDKPEASFTSPGIPMPIVSEFNGIVSLHFSMLEIQSSMIKRAPHRLMLRYTRTMMRFLSLNAQPRHIGMVGLGGGSMVKYCYRKLPDTMISVAEINPNVIALREQFLIPNDDDRLRISCEDGATFVRRQPGVFDVLLVDGFDNAGQPPQLCSQQFYSHCYRSLTPTGVLVANLLGDEQPISRIRRSFGGQVVVAGGDNGTANLVVFASKGAPSSTCDLSSVCIPGKDFEVPMVHRKSVRRGGRARQTRAIPGKARA